MLVRKSEEKDLPFVEKIYMDIHTEEENGRACIGWDRKIYPTRATAEAAHERRDLFIAEDGGIIVGAAIINRQQTDAYNDGGWQYPAKDSEVMVLHTLVISPSCGKKGYGKEFVKFYETYAARQGCPFLRMDTNEKNSRARAMYRKLGYREAGIVPCEFNGIEGVNLVLLEKKNSCG